MAALGNIGTMPAAKALEGAFGDGQPGIKPALCSSIIQCAEALRVHGNRAEAIEIYKWLGPPRPRPNSTRPPFTALSWRARTTL